MALYEGCTKWLEHFRGQRSASGDGGQVDDLAAALALEVGNQGLAHQHHGLEVLGVEGIPDGRWPRQGASIRLDGRLRRSADVVDQDVDAPEAL